MSTEKIASIDEATTTTSQKKGLGVLLAVLAILLGFFLYKRGDAGPEFEPAEGPKLEIKVENAPDEISIGVIYSLTDDPAILVRWHHAMTAM